MPARRRQNSVTPHYSGRGSAVLLLQDDRKLVTAQAGSKVTRTGVTSSSVARNRKQVVTCCVAQRVVHMFEMVQIEKENANAPPLFHGPDSGSTEVGPQRLADWGASSRASCSLAHPSCRPCFAEVCRHVTRDGQDLINLAISRLLIGVTEISHHLRLPFSCRADCRCKPDAVPLHAAASSAALIGYRCSVRPEVLPLATDRRSQRSSSLQ